MNLERFLAGEGSGPLQINYGWALLTQKGGWTMGEILHDFEEENATPLLCDADERSKLVDAHISKNVP